MSLNSEIIDIVFPPCGIGGTSLWEEETATVLKTLASESYEGVRLPAGTASLPGVKIGSQESGFSAYSSQMDIVVAGTRQFYFKNGYLYSQNSNGCAIRNIGGGNSTPTLIPYKSFASTGVGGANDVVSLISGNKTIIKAEYDSGPKITFPYTDGSVEGTISVNSSGDMTFSATGDVIFIPPTSDPGVAGAIWNNSGTLAISAG